MHIGVMDAGDVFGKGAVPCLPFLDELHDDVFVQDIRLLRPVAPVFQFKGYCSHPANPSCHGFENN